MAIGLGIGIIHAWGGGFPLAILLPGFCWFLFSKRALTTDIERGHWILGQVADIFSDQAQQTQRHLQVLHKRAKSPSLMLEVEFGLPSAMDCARRALLETGWVATKQKPFELTLAADLASLDGCLLSGLLQQGTLSFWEVQQYTVNQRRRVATLNRAAKVRIVFLAESKRIRLYVPVEISEKTETRKPAFR